jgi:tetratricopeptide (TPR) repeat protein
MNNIVAKHSKLASRTRPTTAQLFYVGVLCIFTIGLVHAANQSQGTEIAILLEKAEKAFSNNRLTTPAHDNAMSYIDQVLQQKPNDPQARALLDRIVRRYVKWVDDTTQRADSAARYLRLANRFRERAQRVAQSHALPLTQIERMDEKISSVQRKLESVNGDNHHSSVNVLLDHYLRLGNDALAARDLEESAWHARQARTLVQHYHLDVKRVAALEQRLGLKVGLKPLAAAKAENQELKYHQLRAELSASHIDAALAYLELGKLEEAEKHHRAAKSIIEEDCLNNENLLMLTQRIEQQRTALNQPYLTDHRLFGNF